MTALVRCNGKINPLGVETSGIKLSVIIEDTVIKKVCFKIYEGDYTYKNSPVKEPLYYKETNETFINIDDFTFEEQTEYVWYAEVYTGEEKLLTEPGMFETGKFTGFSAKWICDPNFNKYVSEFKRTFNIEGRTEKARLYIVGLGAYQSEINGKKTDEYFYKPLYTDFDKRRNLENPDYDEDNFDMDNKTICCDVFDITTLLKEGSNELKVLLGEGWYFNDDKSLTDPKFYYDRPKLFFEIDYWINGEKKVIASDIDTLCRQTGLKSQLFACDSRDFNFKEKDFISSEYALAPCGRLTASQCERDVIREVIIPEKIIVNGIKAYDFKKNHSGSVYLKVKGQKGSKLVIKYYEFYDENGLNSYSGSCILFDENAKPVDIVLQKDNYILSGGEDEIYPLFNWKCFRYVTIECSEEFQILDLKSLFICSSVSIDGEFKCSNEFINRFHNAFMLTQLDNMHCGIPSDCPHREKLPYTGDGDLTTESVLYNFDCETFYSKWLDDVINSQGKNGWIPYTAPYVGGSGGYFWSNIILNFPLRLYKHFGDIKYLEKSFEAIKKYLDYCVSIKSEGYLLERTCIRWLLGEWLNPDSTIIDVTFFNTLAFYVAADKAAEICDILRKKELKDYYIGLKNKIKDSINENYFDSRSLNYDKGVQGENLFALRLGIVPEKYIKRLYDKVITHYKNKPHFDTGIIVTPAVLDFLTENGETELAYRMFTEKTAPSFYKMLEGETTLCEHWNKKWPDAVYDNEGNEVEEFKDVSHCHPMFGSVVAWMHKSIAGLDLSEMYKRVITFNPKFIKFVSSAAAKKQTRFGSVSVSYSKDDKFRMHVEIPLNCTGKIIIGKDDVKNLWLNGKQLNREANGFYVELPGGKYDLCEK